MNCTRCGAALDAADAFCGSCGAVQSAKTTAAAVAPEPAPAGVSQEMKNCPFCGEGILVSAIKCRFCGSMLNGAHQPAPVAGSISLSAPMAAPAAGTAAAPSIVIQNVQATQPAPIVHPGVYKNPGIALVLSFIFPGGGQFYNGHAGKGILVLLTFWFFGITYVWSLFDAYLSAQRINRVGF